MKSEFWSTIRWAPGRDSNAQYIVGDFRDRQFHNADRVIFCRATAGKSLQDVRWLVGEIRRTHHVLAQIFAAAEDRAADQPMAAKVRFLVNSVMGYYEVEVPESDDSTA